MLPLVPAITRDVYQPRFGCICLAARKIFRNFASVNNTEDMRNRLWILSALVILVNFALVLFCRRSLPAELPLHISLDGSYADTMPYSRLFLHPLVSLALAAGIYIVSALLFRRFPKLDDAKGIRCTNIDIAVCCLALIILCSTCVALTMGKVHFFMFAEPVILLIMLVAIFAGEIRIQKV